MNRCSRPELRGFTLIELMVTLAMLAILLTLAVPSLVSFKRNSELTSTTNSFVAMLGTSRGEAMKRSMTTVVLPLDGTNWANGWFTFVDTNFNGTYQESTDILIKKQEDALPSYFSMTKTNQENLKYNGSGYAHGNTGTFLMATFQIARNDISGAELLTQTRRIMVSSTGRVRVCTPKTSTDINCSGIDD